jgi:hypothetical protein
MNFHYVKIGAAVVAVALLTYVFFPVSAIHDKAITQARQTAQVARHTKSVRIITAKRKHNGAKAKANSTELAKSGGHAIELEKNLRKSQTRSRSGPPSKMYGGL